MIGQEEEHVVKVNENIAFIGLHVSPAHACRITKISQR
jgi:hypothetical protein